jgi:hypothetical protein
MNSPETGIFGPARGRFPAYLQAGTPPFVATRINEAPYERVISVVVRCMDNAVRFMAGSVVLPAIAMY